MNPIKKFFRDYPIIWFLVIFIVIGITAWFLFTKSNQLIHPSSSLYEEPITSAKMRSRASKSGREVKIIPGPSQTPAVSPNVSSVDLNSQLKGTETPTSVSQTTKPKIVFVIDDLGYNDKQAELLFSIHYPLTIAILPHLPYSKYFAEEGKKHGFETILHQPLEPESKTEDPGPGLIKTDMTVGQIQQILKENLASVPGVVGMNNHMGSHATRDRRVMYVIAKELKEQNLFFLDSLTHSQSVAYNVAFALGIPTTKRDVFLDNTDDYNLILGRIKETAQLAKEKGQAVAIGHIRKNTLQALKDEIPKLQADGFEVTSLKELLTKNAAVKSSEETAKQSPGENHVSPNISAKLHGGSAGLSSTLQPAENRRGVI